MIKESFEVPYNIMLSDIFQLSITLTQISKCWEKRMTILPTMKQHINHLKQYNENTLFIQTDEVKQFIKEVIECSDKEKEFHFNEKLKEIKQHFHFTEQDKAECLVRYSSKK